MPVKLEKTGPRLYFLGDTFALKEKIKSLGAHWDAEKRAWWIGARKQAEAEALLADVGAGFDLRNETDRLVRADQLEETGKSEEAAALRKGAPKENPDNIRLTGKGRYKGREYYAGAITKDGLKVRLLTLPNADGDYLDFWAACSEVEEIKRYTPREVWDGRRYSGRTVTQYTTLGGIAKFIARQRRAEAAGEPECAGCGKRGGELVRDLEDGLLKHPRCCDIEP